MASAVVGHDTYVAWSGRLGLPTTVLTITAGVVTAGLRDLSPKSAATQSGATPAAPPLTR